MGGRQLVRWCRGLNGCTMGTPCISYAPQPSPSRHSRNKDAEAVQLRGRVGRSGGEGFTYLFYTYKCSFPGFPWGLWMVALIFHTVTRDLLASRRMRSSWTLRLIATTFMKIMLLNFISTSALPLFQSIADAEPEKYQFHFSEYIKKGIAADDMEALHKKVHATIRADPTMAKSTEEPPKTHKR
ncbi:hypothetical protein VPH35_028583 [Triticum aestivum]